MPVYCFTTEDGQTVDEFFHTTNRPDFITLPDGRAAKFDLAETLNPTPRYSHHRGYPFEDDQLGVNPDQIPEQMAADVKLGVGGTKYNPATGCVVVESREHWQKLKKAQRYHGKNSYTY